MSLPQGCSAKRKIIPDVHDYVHSFLRSGSDTVSVTLKVITNNAEGVHQFYAESVRQLANSFRVFIARVRLPKVLARARTVGLELANAFGVTCC